VQLKDSGASVLVAVDMFYPVISPVLAKTGVRHLILCGIKDYLPFPLNLLYPIKARLDKQWVSVRRVPPIYDFLELMDRSPETRPNIAVAPETRQYYNIPADHGRTERRCPDAPEPRGQRLSVPHLAHGTERG